MKPTLLTGIFAFALYSAPLHAAVVIEEDFSGFSKGTDVAPDMGSPVITDGIVPAELTKTPGWSGSGVFQAGGSVYISAGEGSLATPAINLSGNGGNYKIMFRAKADVASTPLLIMDTQNGSGYGFATLTDEWAEYTMTMNGGTHASVIVFSGMYGGDCIDDIVIDDGGVGIPVLLPASDFTRGSFTANWEETVGADSYALNVFTLRYDPVTTIFKRDYLLEGYIVEGTSHTVADIDFGTPYYYTVCGCQGGNVTFEQEQPMRVIPEAVSAPVAYAATDVNADSFTGSWSESDLATVYAMHVVKVHTARQAETYDIVNTDFSYIHTEGTVDKPQKELSGRIDGDWEVVMPAFAKGLLGLNNQDFSLFDDAMLVSPVYDLSVGGGHVSISFDAMGRRNLTGGFVAMGRYTDSGGIEYVERKEFDVTENMTSFHFDFYGGSARSFILMSSEMLGMLFIDNLRVSVDMNPGESLLVPVRTYDTAQTSCTASSFGLGHDDIAGYYVTGIYRDNAGQFPEVVSEMSNSVVVAGLAGIDATSDDDSNVSVTVSGMDIRIANPYGGCVVICSADGRRIVSDCSGDATLTCRVPSAGIYVVTVDGRAFKVIAD